MTATNVRVQMQQRSDTAANWTAAGPILLAGEIGYETDTGKFKIGDGTTAWGSLDYLPIPDGSGNLTIAGNLEIGSTGTLTFEGSTADDFETTLAVTDPTADRTITLPDVSGTVVTTGDTGSVTSAMITDGTIVDADVSATAEIAVSKLANGTANQVLVTDGTDVSWSDDLTLAGDLTVPLGTAAAPSIHFSGDTNTGIYSPGADQLALSVNGSEKVRLTTTGLGIGTSSPSRLLHCSTSSTTVTARFEETSKSALLIWHPAAAETGLLADGTNQDLVFGTNSLERVRITSSGVIKLPIGIDALFGQVSTTSHAAGNVGSVGLIVSDGGGNSGVFVHNTHDGAFSSQDIRFLTAEGGVSSATERMTIKSTGIVNIANAPVYADNTAATAGGLVAGDVYRTATGQLMITY